jgi:hypothetical protein
VDAVRAGQEGDVDVVVDDEERVADGVAQPPR